MITPFRTVFLFFDRCFNGLQDYQYLYDGPKNKICLAFPSEALVL